MRHAASGCETHEANHTTFEVAQEEDDQRRGRKTLAENLREVPGTRARSQETLRLWSRVSRDGRPIEQRKHREMFQTLFLILAALLVVGLLVVVSRYFSLWLRGFVSRA